MQSFVSPILGLRLPDDEATEVRSFLHQPATKALAQMECYTFGDAVNVSRHKAG